MMQGEIYYLLIKIRRRAMVKKTAKEMLEIAIEMRKKSYAPYSNFCVGACLECTDGKYITGCNIENSSYGATNCAERTAFFKAVSDGITHFSRIAIAGGQRNGALQICPPCGICLQVMMEFCDPEEFQIILATDVEHYDIYTLKELLPLGFGPGNLKKE